jgi:hypothetical protein
MSAIQGHGRRILAASLVALGVGGGAARSARACSPAAPAQATGIPRASSTEVSTATSLVILSGSQPSQVALLAGTTAVPVDGVTAIGSGIDGVSGQPTQFWRVRVLDQFLPASAQLELSAVGPTGTRSTLTTFTTAAAYDKNPGTPAKISNLALRRVRYPVSEIASGNCVFAEYHGYIGVDIEPAVIPGTPPASVVSTLTLAPRHGGAQAQSFMFTGPFKGFPALTDDPSPAAALWKPELDPTLEYCVGITSFGFGDLARLPVTSDPACVSVQQAGAPATGVDAGSDTKATPASSGGCSIGGGERAVGLPLVGWLLLALSSRSARRRRVSCVSVG